MQLPRSTPRRLRGLAVASLVTNIMIVVTGGVVRLTDSGLGCPTVPSCTADSMVPHAELGIHGVIEFGNRLLTFVVGAAAILLWLAALRTRPRVRGVRLMSTIVLAGVPAQALIGWAVVLSDLNPWIVMGHFLVSMVLIGVGVGIVRLTREPSGPARPTVPAPVRLLAVLTLAVTAVVVYIGTIVTGTGPHAGDLEAKRTGLDLESVTQLHAEAVTLLLGLTIGTLLAFRAVDAPTRAKRAATLLLALELGQGVVGYTQYALDLPRVLVGTHLLGAALIVAAATAVLLGTRERIDSQLRGEQVGGTLDEAADDRHSAAV